MDWKHQREVVILSSFVFIFILQMSKIDPNRGGSYTDFTDWEKKGTINPINRNDNKLIQYAVTIALNHEEIKKDPQRIIKIKAFFNKYKWQGINYPSEKNNLEKIRKNNLEITLNVLYTKNENIYPAIISKHNSNREKHVIPLMIPNGEAWH